MWSETLSGGKKKTNPRSVQTRTRRNESATLGGDRTDTTCQIQCVGIKRLEENITRKTRQMMTFVFITNVPTTALGSKEILFTYKGQLVVEVQFHLLKTHCLASQIFLEKPGSGLMVL